MTLKFLCYELSTRPQHPKPLRVQNPYHTTQTPEQTPTISLPTMMQSKPTMSKQKKKTINQRTMQ